MSKADLKFLDYFEEITDPRIERKKLYLIEEILLIIIRRL